MAEIDYVYFKLNVNFNIGVRLNRHDNEGMVLSKANPYININRDNLKEFLQANKYAIQNGMIKESAEPVFDFLTDNALDDEEITKLVKNMFLLKKRLANINSDVTLLKILAEAQKQKRAQSVITLIEERIEAINPTLLQGGVDWENNPTGSETQ